MTNNVKINMIVHKYSWSIYQQMYSNYFRNLHPSSNPTILRPQPNTQFCRRTSGPESAHDDEHSGVHTNELDLADPQGQRWVERFERNTYHCSNFRILSHLRSHGRQEVRNAPCACPPAEGRQSGVELVGRPQSAAADDGHRQRAVQERHTRRLRWPRHQCAVREIAFLNWRGGRVVLRIDAAAECRNDAAQMSAWGNWAAVFRTIESSTADLFLFGFLFVQRFTRSMQKSPTLRV